MRVDSAKNPQTLSTYITSLETLRFLAILCVSLQHGLSVIHREELTKWHGLSIGQFGVSVFCALSGFLALRDQRAAQTWLRRRLATIFPSYWIVMAGSFLLTWLTGYESFDWYQFGSQMAGLGFFTHGWALVNVASWFISLLLLCYGFVFIAKLSRRPAVVMILLTVLAIGSLGFRLETSLSRHVIAFNLAALAGYWFPSFSPFMLLGLSGGLVLLAPISQEFLYAAVALGLLRLALLFPAWSTRSIQRLSKYIYEYFLVHGIFFIGSTTLIKNAPLLSLPLAVVSSAFSAWLLKSLVETCTLRMRHSKTA